MESTPQQGPRNERVNLRLTPTERDTVARAARREALDTATFARRAAVTAANAVLATDKPAQV